MPIDVDVLARRSLQSPKVTEAKEHRLGGHGLKMDALDRLGRVKVLETASARRVELKAYTSLRMSQNTQKLAALLKVQQTLSSSSSRPSTVARQRGCDGGRCTGRQTDGPPAGVRIPGTCQRPACLSSPSSLAVASMWPRSKSWSGRR